MYLVRKNDGRDKNKLYAMKEVNKIEVLLLGIDFAKRIKYEREVIALSINQNAKIRSICISLSLSLFVP